MANIELSHSAPTGASIARRMKRMLSEVANWQRARRTASALNRLSSHQLTDIGIEPGDIDGFAERISTRR